MKDEFITGDKIDYLATIPSWYANGRVRVRIKGEEEDFMIEVDDLLKLMKRRKFSVQKKRKYKYLKVLRR